MCNGLKICLTCLCRLKEKAVLTSKQVILRQKKTSQNKIQIDTVRWKYNTYEVS